MAADPAVLLRAGDPEPLVHLLEAAERACRKLWIEYRRTAERVGFPEPAAHECWAEAGITLTARSWNAEARTTTRTHWW